MSSSANARTAPSPESSDLCAAPCPTVLARSSKKGRTSSCLASPRNMAEGLTATRLVPLRTPSALGAPPEPWAPRAPSAPRVPPTPWMPLTPRAPPVPWTSAAPRPLPPPFRMPITLPWAPPAPLRPFFSSIAAIWPTSIWTPLRPISYPAGEQVVSGTAPPQARGFPSHPATMMSPGTSHPAAWTPWMAPAAMASARPMIASGRSRLARFASLSPNRAPSVDPQRLPSSSTSNEHSGCSAPTD